MATKAGDKVYGETVLNKNVVSRSLKVASDCELTTSAGGPVGEQLLQHTMLFVFNKRCLKTESVMFGFRMWCSRLTVARSPNDNQNTSAVSWGAETILMLGEQHFEQSSHASTESPYYDYFINYLIT